ncbi:hypothetical protein AN1V17_32670 [Vallitalea sediminicola]
MSIIRRIVEACTDIGFITTLDPNTKTTIRIKLINFLDILCPPFKYMIFITFPLNTIQFGIMNIKIPSLP